MSKHGYDKTPPGSYANKRNNMIMLVGAVGMALVIGSFILGEGYFRHVVGKKRVEGWQATSSPELLRLRSEENEVLTTYGKVSDSTGTTIRIPIERAMELVVDERGGQ